MVTKWLQNNKVELWQLDLGRGNMTHVYLKKHCHSWKFWFLALFLSPIYQSQQGLALMCYG